MPETTGPIGRITRCSTQLFSGAVHPSALSRPAFGAFCQAEDTAGEIKVIGVIYDLRIEDDPLARQMAALEDLPAEQLADAQKNRQAPVEFSALTVGYEQGDRIIYALPPRPPLTLSPVFLLSGQDLLRFTGEASFARLILASPNLPSEQLLAAALRSAIAARPEGDRDRYQLLAGRTVARLLAGDLPRLENVLGALR
ncbi:MAG: hypothetical protein ACK2T2_12830 [Anaerolineales bacterium]